MKYGIFDQDGKPITFYSIEVHPTIPSEAIEITDEQWQELISDQNLKRYVNGEVINRTISIEEQLDSLFRQCVTAMDNLFDETAKQKQYDNRITCSLRAGYTGPFQAEGIAFAQWMDSCYSYGYQVIADVIAQTRTPPTVEEFLAELPTFTWPT